VALLLVLAGISEGFGVGALLPLFRQLAAGAAGSENWVGRGIETLLAQFGFAPTMGSLLGLVALMMVIKGGLVLLAMQQVGYAVATVETDLRLSLIRSLMNADWLYFTGQASGRFANAVTTEAYYASHCYDITTRLLAEGVQLLVYATLSFLVSWKMTLGGLMGGGMCVLILSRLNAMARRSGEKQTRLLNAVSERLVDGIGNIKPLKAMACEDRLIPLLESEIEGLRHAKERQVLSFGALRAMTEPLFVVVLAGATYLAFRALQSEIEVLALLILLFWRSLLRIGGVQFNFQELARYQSAYWSIRSAVEEAERSAEQIGGRKSPSLNVGLEFCDLSFSHTEKIVLDRVSLTISPGSVTALVGPSGQGKTTVADLIAGLLSPDSGEVLIDRVPLGEIDLRTWRSMIGYAPQESILFHDTVFTNVTLRAPDLTRAHAEAALKAAGAWEIVSGLPDGMETVVGERGGKLSGGQRQRIVLARALIRNPRMLILDEVTSSLDSESEAEILATLSGLKGKTTMLIISHRPAAAEIADRVYRIENGRVELEAPRSMAPTSEVLGS